MHDELRQALDDPERLETLYRRDAAGFIRAFTVATQSSADSPLVRYWKIRLAYDNPGTRFETAVASPQRMLGWFVLAIALVAGTIAKIPDFFPVLGPEIFYLRNAGVILFAALAAYFLFVRQVPQKTIIVAAGIFTGAAIYINRLPQNDYSDTMTLAYLHLPLFLWTVAGIVFSGTWRANTSARIDYLKFNGELAIYTVLLLIGGQALTFLTIALFSAITIDIFEWYLHWGVIYGLTAAPIVGAHLAWTRSKTSPRISPLIAKIFSPLFLITLVVYLVAAASHGRSPYTDREFLVIFNAVLLVVLAISIFTLTEQTDGRRRIGLQLTTLGLLAAGLLVDLVALSAIVFRLGSFGLTPNRVAVLGANLLIFVNTAGLLWNFVKDWRTGTGPGKVWPWIANFLPVYAAWTAFVTFLLPLLYQFE